MYHPTIAYLSYWLSLVESIDDDIHEWVLFSSNYIKETDERFFIEYLLKKCNTYT